MLPCGAATREALTCQSPRRRPGRAGAETLGSQADVFIRRRVRIRLDPPEGRVHDTAMHADQPGKLEEGRQHDAVRNPTLNLIQERLTRAPLTDGGLLL